MKLFRVLLFCTCGITFPAVAADLQTALPLNIGGRVAVSETDGSLAFGWPGIYFEGRFHGKTVAVGLDSDQDFLSLRIDGQERALLKKPGAARLTFDDLGDGDHTIRLEKVTESQSGVGGRFIGFFVAHPAEILPPPRRTRRIEFIGDSYTVGYGNISTTQTCDVQHVHDTTDTQQAYAALIANHFDADFRINAYSGRGIVRNYNGAAPGETLPVLYQRAIPGLASSVDSQPAAWHPQVIVVGLGTNDFSTPLHAGEPWRDLDALHADYRKRYDEFIRTLRARDPRALIVLVATDNGGFEADVRSLVAGLSAGGDPQIRSFTMSGLNWGGCHSHPSLKDDKLVAEGIATLLESEKGVWE